MVSAVLAEEVLAAVAPAAVGNGIGLRAQGSGLRTLI